MIQEETTALAASLATAKEYADTIVKPPLKNLGGMLADTVGFWRLKNKINFLLKTKAFFERKGIKPQKLVPNVIVPLLEEASNTDDESLSEMFARLLASHLDPAAKHGVHPAFAKVLGQLSPLDALVMKVIDDHTRDDATSRFFDLDPLKPAMIPDQPWRGGELSAVHPRTAVPRQVAFDHGLKADRTDFDNSAKMPANQPAFSTRLSGIRFCDTKSGFGCDIMETAVR